MEEISQRIKELIDKEGLSNSEFAKKIDVNPSIISHVLSGRNKPSLHLIDAIKTSFTNVNLEYLISGKDRLYIDFTNVNEPEKTVSSPKNLQSNLTFPMEGIRHAAIPGDTIPLPKDQPEENSEANTETRSAPPLPSGKGERIREEPVKKSGKEIEQIVIFYSDGSFKAYQP